jgi:SAM-dependent methyltransferase
MIGHLEKIRSAELETLIEVFQRDKPKVLEIGGGNGWQARVLETWGCDVVSIDLPDRPIQSKQYFHVQDYDGVIFPLADEEFDVVFSSNVLEHVQDLPGILREIRRVLKPRGCAIHILPTPTWRFFTSLAHYAFLASVVLSRFKENVGDINLPNAGRIIQAKGRMYFLKRIFFAGPHGEYPSAFSELYFFSNRRWSTIFRSGGFTIVDSTSTGIFYTGYALFPGINIATRQRLSKYLGSSCRTYKMIKTAF